MARRSFTFAAARRDDPAGMAASAERQKTSTIRRSGIRIPRCETCGATPHPMRLHLCRVCLTEICEECGGETGDQTASMFVCRECPTPNKE